MLILNDQEKNAFQSFHKILALKCLIAEAFSTINSTLCAFYRIQKMVNEVYDIDNLDIVSKQSKMVDRSRAVPLLWIIFVIFVSCMSCCQVC